MKLQTRYVLYFLLVVTALFCPVKALGSFDQDLYYGVDNTIDVTALQTFLSTKSFYDGPITGNYLSLTKQAVQTFQNQEGISPASGYFGTESRRIANALMDSVATTTQLVGANLTVSSTTAVTSQSLNIGVSAPASSVDIVALASTTETLTQQIASLILQMTLLQSQIDALTSTVNDMSGQILTLQTAQIDTSVTLPVATSLPASLPPTPLLPTSGSGSATTSAPVTATTTVKIATSTPPTKTATTTPSLVKPPIKPSVKPPLLPVLPPLPSIQIATSTAKVSTTTKSTY